MTMPSDYEVITSTRIADLQDRVRERMKAGWRPIGGIAMLHEDEAGRHDPRMVFAQALIQESGGAAS